MGAGMSGTASGCATGAISGVTGEVVGSTLYQNGTNPYNLNKETIAQISGLSAATIAAAISGPDGQSNIFAGNQIGYNGAKNNALWFKDEKIKHTDWIKKDYDVKKEKVPGHFFASNCHDWSQLVRAEYNYLQIQGNLDTWNSIINLNTR